MNQQISMANKVLTNLRTDIINGTYKQDQLITEKDISEQYKVSKTPVREALISLCMEGLLEKIPYKGYFVKSINVNDINALFEFRRILECSIIELVIDRLSASELQYLKELAEVRIDTGNTNDPNLLNQYNDINCTFHLALARMTRNPYIVSTYENVLNRLRRALIMDLKQTDINQLLNTHTLIVEELSNHDLHAALERTTNGIVVIERRINSSSNHEGALPYRWETRRFSK
jgi:GntR family transcriptional regulator, rspAB operon transcriptional repressor